MEEINQNILAKEVRLIGIDREERTMEKIKCF